MWGSWITFVSDEGETRDVMECGDSNHQSNNHHIHKHRQRKSIDCGPITSVALPSDFQLMSSSCPSSSIPFSIISNPPFASLLHPIPWIIINPTSKQAITFPPRAAFFKTAKAPSLSPFDRRDFASMMGEVFVSSGSCWSDMRRKRGREKWMERSENWRMKVIESISGIKHTYSTFSRSNVNVWIKCVCFHSLIHQFTQLFSHHLLIVSFSSITHPLSLPFPYQI